MSSNPDYLAQRLTWRSSSSFAMVTVGATQCLGPLWVLPFIANAYGLGAFAITYILLLLVVGLPAMLAELMLGRRGQQNAVSTIRLLALEVNRSTLWEVIPWVGCGVLLFGMVTTSIAGGWSLLTVYQFLEKHFLNQTSQAVGHWNHLGWFSLFLLFSLYQASLGLHRGIERLSTFSMALMVVILLGLIGFNVTQHQFINVLTSTLNPDFSRMTGKGIAIAMMAVLLNLNLGTGALMVYGSYAPRGIALGRVVWLVVFYHLILLTLGLGVVFPWINHQPVLWEQGQGLLLSTTPMQVSGSVQPPWMTALFFMVVIFGLMPVTLSKIEPLVILIIEKYNTTRLPAIGVIGIIAWVMGAVIISAFDQVSFRFLLVFLPQHIILPLVSFGFCLFVGWFMQKRLSLAELSFKANCCYWLWLILLRFVVPFALILMMIQWL